MQLIDRLGDKYQIDELAAKYEFTGRTVPTIPQAIEIKKELEEIDRLLKQLEEAAKTAQIGIIDLEALSEYAEPGDIEKLNDFARQIEQYLRDLAEQQGLERNERGYQLTPKAYRLFQGRLLDRIFSNLEAARSGRHQGPIVGEGAVEMQQTKPYEFGDSLANMDLAGSLTNAMIRDGPKLPDPPEAGGHRNPPHAEHAEVRDGRAAGHERLDALRRAVRQREADGPGPRRADPPRISGRLSAIRRNVHVRQTAAAGRNRATHAQAGHGLRFDRPAPRRHERPEHERDVRAAAFHQHSARAASFRRQLLAAQDTPNRRVILITDGLPTAHFEGKFLYLLYPPDRRTEEATLREGNLCRREGITINIFLLPSWSQSREDVQFAYRLAESTLGKVFFTAGRDLDRYVLWDYLNRRREIVA